MADTLTEREREVLRLLGQGRSTAEIAGALGMSEDTVRFFVAHVVERIGPARVDETARRLAVRARFERMVAASATPLVAFGLALFALGVIVAGVRIADRSAPATPPAPTASPSAAATASPEYPAGGPSKSGSSSVEATPAATLRPPPTFAPLPTVPPLATSALPVPTVPLPVPSSPAQPLPTPAPPLPSPPLPTLPLPTPSLP